MTTTTEAPPDEQTIPTTDGLPEPEGPVTIVAPSGSLTLDRTSTQLTAEQKAALSAITNADPDSKVALPHLRVFLHVCQKMDLDPWRKQAYLIARGESNKQKFTIQVGIDGYRTVAARTRLMIGAATWLWTGSDDDEKSWRFNESTGVMQRVWYDEWPESRGYPGAAKAVIRHYDALGREVVSDAVAHWGMYAPFYPKTEWVNNRKVYIKDDDGKDVLELGEMWAKGYHHMLAKCAEALVLRKVFPDEFAGTVTFEEMARADMEERQRRERAQAAARKRAYADAKARQQGTPEQPVAPTPEGTDAAASGEQGDGEQPVAPTEGEGQPAAVAEVIDEETARGHWLTELAWQAEQMGTTPAALASRFVRARRTSIEDFPLDALAPVVHGFRPVVVERLKQNERPGEAERYAAWISEEGTEPLVIADLDAVLTGTGDDAGEPEPDPATPAPAEADEPAAGTPEPDATPEPEQPAEDAQPPAEGAGDSEVDGPHAFVKAKGRNPGPECAAPGCGFYADDPIHTVPDLDGGAEQ